MKPKALLFDLDGTLLPLEFNEFIPKYFAELSRKFSKLFSGRNLPELITVSTDKMVYNDGSQSNSDAFWTDFAPLTGFTREVLEPLFQEFYREDFGRLGDGVGVWPEAARTVETAKNAGCLTVLATNPVFPRLAIDHRLAWARVNPGSFDLITDYETMRYAKPNPEYYKQVAQEIGVEPTACLMVGNDVTLDLAPARQAGMVTFMVDNQYTVTVDGFSPDFRGVLTDIPKLFNLI